LIRPAHFFQQLKKLDNEPGREDIVPALRLLVVGLIKKVLIADGLAALGDIAFRAANHPMQNVVFPTPLYLQGFYLYAFQIYADFSGYTDIARASAALLGFSLPENFQQPYLSNSLTMFWNRWHMSLTQWFRENLFFPLNRTLLKATQRRYPRLVQVGTTLITMSIIGLWHGAAWTYVAWGFWHGILLALEQQLGIRPTRAWQQVLQGCVTFHLVSLGWILFGSSSFQASVRFLEGLFSFQQMAWVPYYLPSILVTGCLLIAIDLAGRYVLADRSVVLKMSRPILLTAGILLFIFLVTLNTARGVEVRPFIYGQF
jgi:alginate O-acetyltransferase complex protein AlgI